MPPQPPNDVGNGEAAAGVAIDFYGRTFEHEIGSAGSDSSPPAPPPPSRLTAWLILYGVKGDRQVLARRFVQFLLTPRGQLLWILKPRPAWRPVRAGPASLADPPRPLCPGCQPKRMGR